MTKVPVKVDTEYSIDLMDMMVVLRAGMPNGLDFYLPSAGMARDFDIPHAHHHKVRKLLEEIDRVQREAYRAYARLLED